MCDACAIAKINARTARFNVGCIECSARALAQAPAFHESMTADAMTPRYRDALQMIFGGDWLEGHTRTKAWYEKLKG